jgi:hypothetical protein
MSNILNCIQIDETHCQAIREEIGERLRIELKVSPPMSLKLVQLLARLPELDHHDSPSIVPSHEDADRMVEEFANAN